MSTDPQTLLATLRARALRALREGNWTEEEAEMEREISRHRKAS